MHRVFSLSDIFPEPATMEPAQAPGMSESESELVLEMLMQELTPQEQNVTLLAPAAMEPAPAQGMSKSKSQLMFEMFIQELTAHEQDATLPNFEETDSDDVVVIENPIHHNHSNVEMLMEQEFMTTQEETLSKPEESDSNDNMVIIENSNHHDHQHPAAPLAPPPIDSKEYTTYLWNKLELECAAFKALKWGSSSQPQNLSPVTQPTKPSQWGTTAHGIGHGVSMAQSEALTNGSLTTYYNDNELEGNTDTTSYFDPEAKRAKRLQSNRESAKRSRKKQDEHTSEITAQVHYLRKEHLSLQRSRAYNVQKSKETIVKHKNKKAKIERLSAQVKMAEKQKKGQGMPFVSNPMASSTNVAVPMQPNYNQFFYQPVPTISGSSYPNTLVPIVGNLPSNVGGNNMVMTSYMQQAAGLEHVQEWTGFGTTPSPNWYTPGWY